MFLFQGLRVSVKAFPESQSDCHMKLSFSFEAGCDRPRMPEVVFCITLCPESSGSTGHTVLHACQDNTVSTKRGLCPGCL